MPKQPEHPPMIEIIEIQDLEPTSTPADPSRSITEVPAQTFVLAPNLKQQLPSIRLPAKCWELLQQVDGQRDSTQIAQGLQRDHNAVLDDCQRLLYIGAIIEKGAMSYAQFKQSSQTQELDSNATTSPTNGMCLVDNATEAKPKAAPTSTQNPAQIGRGMMLSCLTNLVRRARGGGRRGELAVYLMFTRVPAELFRQAGLRSFLYIDENTRIDNTQLAQRLIEEAQQITGHSLNDELSNCLKRQQALSA